MGGWVLLSGLFAGFVLVVQKENRCAGVPENAKTSSAVFN